MSNPLKQAILNWDGKSVSVLADILTTYQYDNDLIERVVELLADSACQKAASRLLKAALEQGQAITAEQSAAVIDQLHNFSDWESKLHLLQSLSFLSIDPSQKSAVEQFLRATLCDTNKFVRAWAYNGFYVLAKLYPEYQAETQQFFDMAMRDEAASVQARVRRCLKQGF